MPRGRGVGIAPNPLNPLPEWRPPSGPPDWSGYHGIGSIIPSGSGASGAQPANGRVLTYQPATEAIPIIYGAARVGGLLVYQNILATGELVVVYLVCHGPINSISNITIDQKTMATLGLVVTTNYETYTGTAAQGISPLVSAIETQWVSGLPGFAYVVVKFPVPTPTLPAVDPYRFQCDVQGLLVRDPRTDATLVNRYYRENPALVLADILTAKRYGAAIADANVDWSGSTTDSANYCDVVVPSGAARWKIGIALRNAASLQQQIDTIRAHAQLFVSYNNGQYQIVADQAQTASGITYDDGSLLDGAVMRIKGSAEVPTSVSVRYIDASNSYKDGTAEVEHPGIALGTIERVRATYDLPGCPSFDQARRICLYLFNRSALDKDILFRTNAEGVRPLPGNRIQVTSTELNLSLQDVIVLDCQPDPDGLTWTIRGELYDASIYSDVAQTTTAGISPGITSPYDAPPDVTAVVSSVSSVYWTPPAWPFPGKYRIYDKRSGSRVLYAEFDSVNPPTVAKPYNTVPIVTDATDTVGTRVRSWNFDVVFVTPVGKESAGVNTTSSNTVVNGAYTPSYIPQIELGVTLANGANNNVAINQDTGQMVISGPTGAFSITGITGGFLGRTLRITNNTTQTLTISHANVGSTAANRFNLWKGQDLLIYGKGTALLHYSGTNWYTNSSQTTGNVEIGLFGWSGYGWTAGFSWKSYLNFRERRPSVPTLTLSGGSNVNLTSGPGASTITVDGFGFDGYVTAAGQVSALDWTYTTSV